MKVEDAGHGFLSRWARRKEQARTGAAIAPEPPTAAVAAAPSEPSARGVTEVEAGAPDAAPLPTLADVAVLTRDSDYSRFVARGVDEGVKQAAMKKLFTDPHFNVMDGLDTYIDDYSKPDPIPLAMLRRMNQSQALRLFEQEAEDETKQLARDTNDADVEPDAPPDHLTSPDDHADLRLQQDHAAGRPGPDQGVGA